MTNHIHFLVTPNRNTGVSDTTKVVGSRYAQYFNRKYGRTGTLWEGRHRSSLVQTEDYLLTCMRYIELNPVRAGMVVHPEEYQWSSYGFNAWGDKGWLKPHENYLKLANDEDGRYRAYSDLFLNQISGEDINLIRKAAHYCQPVGNDRFRKMIEEKYGIKPGYLKRGRPKITL